MTAYAAAWKGAARGESAAGWYRLDTLLPTGTFPLSKSISSYPADAAESR